MQKFAVDFINDESGATAIEYGLIALIVGVGIMVGLGGVKNELNGLFNNIGTYLKTPGV